MAFGATAVPAVIDGVYALAVAQQVAGGSLEGVLVGDGWLITDSPGSYLMIGVEDPDLPAANFSAESVQSWPHVNHQVTDEDGEITCAAVCWNGDGDAKAARDAVNAAAAGLARALAIDPTVGLPSPAWTRFGSRVQLNQAQDIDGAYAQLIFRIWFRARLTLT